MNKKNQITSFESEDSGVFGDILTSRPVARRPQVGLLALGYFEYWRMYPALEGQVAADLDAAGKRLAAALPGCDLVYPGMVDTLDRAEEAGEKFCAAQLDALVVIAGTYLPDFITMHVINKCTTKPALILFDSQTGDNVNPLDDYVATMRNSALIAITQLSGSFRKMKLEYDTVVGEISDPEAYREIADTVQAVAAVRRLRGSTYGLIGHVFRGMYDLEFDRARVKGFLGPEVMTIQAEHLIEQWQTVPEESTEQAAQKLLRRFKTRNLSIEEVKPSLRLGLAMRELYRKFNLDGLCFLGQHYIEKMTGAPARMGASMLMEEDRFLVGCEGDIGGLVMMDLMHQFTGNLPFQAEWGQFDRANNAIFLLGHGIGTPDLAKSDDAITLTGSPEEWGFKGAGLNYELILKPGEVTLGHFLNAGDSYQMLISSGESIDFPTLPCNELHAMIKVKSETRQFLKQIISAGSAHHVIVVHGDAVQALQKTANLMRIESVSIE
jgi:L-arabinose isomerase